MVNTGGGYLMMIPQTLPAGARLIVGVDDGRPDVEFDLSGITWSSGQRINYSLSVSPDAIIMLTPERIVLPPMGGFSQFNVIVQNESPKTWTISGTNFYICDNFADLQGWAAGTLTAANVKNLDGTIPVIGSYSGSGTTTLYAWKPTSNNSTTNEITGTIVNTDDTDIKNQPCATARLCVISDTRQLYPRSIRRSILENNQKGAYHTHTCQFIIACGKLGMHRCSGWATDGARVILYSVRRIPTMRA